MLHGVERVLFWKGWQPVAEGHRGMPVGVWRPHHGNHTYDVYSHHTISVQPRCMMLGRYALQRRTKQSQAWISLRGQPRISGFEADTHPHVVVAPGLLESSME